METVQIDPKRLVLDDRNPRIGRVEELKAYLKEFGQHRAAVVQRGSNKVIVGNHMVKAAISLGWQTIGCYFVDDTDTKARRRSLADNVSSSRGDWDLDVLGELLVEVNDPIPGLDDGFLEDIGLILSRDQPIVELSREEFAGSYTPSYGQTPTDLDRPGGTAPEGNMPPAPNPNYERKYQPNRTVVIAAYLDTERGQQWSQLKERLGTKDDTIALIKLIDENL